ncbi:hypothetical protein [Methanococcoides sp. FTZ1]|uniref:hypothetical protein n=1 Tax=Methanococcoides sp. FTZ1 TaxID=3439061 RepID=UPI003F8415A5
MKPIFELLRTNQQLKTLKKEEDDLLPHLAKASKSNSKLYHQIIKLEAKGEKVDDVLLKAKADAEEKIMMIAEKKSEIGRERFDLTFGKFTDQELSILKVIDVLSVKERIIVQLMQGPQKTSEIAANLYSISAPETKGKKRKSYGKCHNVTVALKMLCDENILDRKKIKTGQRGQPPTFYSIKMDLETLRKISMLYPRLIPIIQADKDFTFIKIIYDSHKELISELVYSDISEEFSKESQKKFDDPTRRYASTRGINRSVLGRVIHRVGGNFQLKLSQSLNFYKLCLFTESKYPSSSEYPVNTNHVNVSNLLRNSYNLEDRLNYMKSSAGTVSDTVELTKEMVSVPDIENLYYTELPDLLDVGLRVCLIADSLEGNMSDKFERDSRRDSRLLELYNYVAAYG